MTLFKRSVRHALALLAIGAALAAFAPPASAIDGAGRFAVRGLGTQTCKAVLPALQTDKASDEALATWMMGYISAMNRMASDTFDVSPVLEPVALLQMVASLCQRQPEMQVEAVLIELLKALGPARVHADTPIVTMQEGTANARLRAETLASIQRALTKGGFYAGPANGAADAATVAGLKAFQKSQSLAQTGVADPATLVRILVDLPSRQAAAAPPAAVKQTGANPALKTPVKH